jgi:hypothetical protein
MRKPGGRGDWCDGEVDIGRGFSAHNHRLNAIKLVV